METQIKSIGSDKKCLKMSYESYRLCKSAARNELEHQDTCIIVGMIGVPVKILVPKICYN